MDEPMPNSHFRIMAALIGLRNRLSPRRPVLEEAGVRPGLVVLDYGCGPGGYTLPAAEMVGPDGHVHAADIHPMAIERVEGGARRRGLSNVTAIMTDRDTGLPEESVDIALLYDILHLLSEPEGVVAELHRVLRPSGRLSVWGHNMDRTERLTEGVIGGMFALERRGRHTLSYKKVPIGEEGGGLR